MVFGLPQLEYVIHMFRERSESEKSKTQLQSLNPVRRPLTSHLPHVVEHVVVVP